MLQWDKYSDFGVAVQDVSRVAAVIQLVTKQGDTIYGKGASTATHLSLFADALCLAASDSRKRGKAAGY